MKIYHLALILIVLAALLGLIARELGKALGSGRSHTDGRQSGSLTWPSGKLANEEPSLTEQPAAIVQRTRQRTLKSHSAGGGDPNLAQQLLERDIYGQLEISLERAFESYISGRTTLGRYRKTIMAERMAMIRHLDEINAGRSTEVDDRSQAESAEAALATIDWCLRWADDIERQKRTDCDSARSAAAKLQGAA